MKVNTNSWHFRLVRSFYDSMVPENLCAYFWKLVFAMVASLIMSAAVVFVAVMLVVSMFAPFFGLYIGSAITITFIGWIMVGYVLIMLYRESDHYIEAAYNKSSHAVKKENLFFAWVKAKKQKVCPTLEFY